MEQRVHDIRRHEYFGADLANCAYYLFKNQGSAPSKYYNMAGFVFLTFLIESYINYVAGELSQAQGWNKDWKELEKKLSPKEKLFLLKKSLPPASLEDWPDWATQIFKFRNDIAHMKAQEIQIEGSPKSLDCIDLDDPGLSAKHEKFLNSCGDTMDYYCKVKHFLEQIANTCEIIGYPVARFNWPSGYSSTTRIVADNSRACSSVG